jgi:hypothetical protein
VRGNVLLASVTTRKPHSPHLPWVAEEAPLHLRQSIAVATPPTYDTQRQRHWRAHWAVVAGRARHPSHDACTRPLTASNSMPQVEPSLSLNRAAATGTGPLFASAEQAERNGPDEVRSLCLAGSFVWTGCVSWWKLGARRSWISSW